MPFRRSQKNDAYSSATLVADCHPSFQLQLEAIDQFHAHRSYSFDTEILPQAYPIVGDLEPETLVAEISQADIDDAVIPVGEGVFYAIGNGFIDDQPDGHGLVHVQPNRVDMQPEMELTVLRKTFLYVPDKLGNIPVHMDELQVVGLIKPLVDDGHRIHAISALSQCGHGLFIFQVVGLGIEQAYRDLQTILDPVMDLLEEHFLFGKQLVSGKMDVFQLQYLVVERLLLLVEPVLALFDDPITVNTNGQQDEDQQNANQH